MSGEAAHICAHAHLTRCFGVLGDDELALDQTVAGHHADGGADLAGLWDVEFLHNGYWAGLSAVRGTARAQFIGGSTFNPPAR